MSNVKSVKSKKAVKTVKLPKEVNLPEIDQQEPPKKRGRAPKKPLSKEESLKLLQDASNEIKQIIDDLKEDEMKMSGLQLKKVPMLLKETIDNLIEDKEEFDEKHKELMALPAVGGTQKTE